jgi:hypothetical protein
VPNNQIVMNPNTPPKAVIPLGEIPKRNPVKARIAPNR